MNVGGGEAADQTVRMMLTGCEVSSAERLCSEKYPGPDNGPSQESQDHFR